MSDENTSVSTPKKKEPVIIPVQLTDGRIVDFTERRKLIKESTIADDGTVSLRIDFRNGETRTYIMPSSLLLRFAAHGFEQKYGDEAAMGKDADLTDIVAAIDALDFHIQRGEWNKARESTGGNSFSGTSIVLQALCEWKGWPKSKAMEFVESKISGDAPQYKTRQELYSALRQLSALRPIIERLEAERASGVTSNRVAELESELLAG